MTVTVQERELAVAVPTIPIEVAGSDLAERVPEEVAARQWPQVDMAAEPIIRVENVWKRYTTAEYRPSLRHEGVTLLRRTLGLLRDNRPQAEPFYALRNVSFDVRPGEAVAIIGRNGSGKTTMLRLLSGITQPTMGQISVARRFACLIALGAGFNPEMSGRDNILLNAAIQGVPPKQTRLLMDDIIEFADIGTFIDVPVKRYSSGMNARLGFSIAIHILPDILFVDEVLAVGDAAFQEKCNERIAQFRERGGTLVLVTHTNAMVRRLCPRTIWLHGGECVLDGATDDVLPQYLNFTDVHGG